MEEMCFHLKRFLWISEFKMNFVRYGDHLQFSPGWPTDNRSRVSWSVMVTYLLALLVVILYNTFQDGADLNMAITVMVSKFSRFSIFWKYLLPVNMSVNANKIKCCDIINNH